jgi:hypothetical protein
MLLKSIVRTKPRICALPARLSASLLLAERIGDVFPPRSLRVADLCNQARSSDPSATTKLEAGLGSRGQTCSHSSKR